MLIAISLIASAVAVFLSLLLTFAPLTESMTTAPYTVVALIVALLTGRPWRGLRPAWGWLMLALALGLLVPVTAIARAFGDLDMLAILFHVDFGTDGAGLAGLERDLAVAGFVAATTFAGLVIFSQMAARPHLVWIFGVVLLVANPFLRQIAAMTLPIGGMSETESLLTNLVDPTIRTDNPDDRPDVVIIYLEGMDQIFEDQDRFQDALGQLKTLAGPGAIELTGVSEMVGTGWSLAGMVASQCGVPVLPNGIRFENNFTDQRNFMNDLTCLGDVLDARGYATEFVMGGEKEFAGINHFYASHGVTTQTDIAVIAEMISQDEFDAAFPGWVLDDQMSLDIARRRHAELSASDTPLFLVVETMGPHGREVWLSRRCTQTGRAEIATDVAAGVRCTADLAVDFVEKIRNSPGARPTLFVLLSDHINHNPDLVGPDGIEARRNTVILIPPVRAGEIAPLMTIDRDATMVDVYPTILDILNLIESGGAAGLGVSLLGEAPTLVERFGRQDIDRTLARDGPLAARLWE
jgi:phosphoglycerol transferase